ncbi:tektin-1 [Gouania willdenowi]|uniref:Tektin n=1 Tax=Gouania willdenowi TaxID=441366 RepID=A0A8C5HHK6_GOUWI|nr:tektin-1-like [Gouania willdenowi]XP_028321027.1 tektin-1-like [Gouania willdenowi]XP_028321028.1 tektin-1-like [Gouania willdenowi]
MAFRDHCAQQRRDKNLLRDEILLKKSEHMRKECEGLVVNTTRAGQCMLDDDKNGLDQRVKEIEFVKSEMEHKMEEVTSEIDELITLQSKVTNARYSAEKILRVTMFCMEERMKRYFSELVQDDVDTELSRERNIIEGVISLLQNVDEQITEQMRLNRSAKFHLEQDLKGKLEAQSIDQSCSVIRDHSINTLSLNNAPPSVPVTPQQWENKSDLIIKEIALHKTNSLSLRALVKSVLGQTAADMQKQVQATTEALERNVKDMKFTKSQIENKIHKMNSEMSDHERMRVNLQTAITHNEQLLSLAEGRLAMRSQRPGIENCHDTMQTRLLAEVQRFNAQIRDLQNAEAQSKEHQTALHIRQIQLQESVNLKANSIYIDEVICIQQRESILIPTV